MAYLFTLLYITLYYIRPFEWSLAFREYPVLPVIGGVGFLWVIFSKFRNAGKIFENGTDLMMVGFLLALVLSHLSHLWFWGAMKSIEGFSPIFIGYFLIAHSIDSNRKLEGFITVIILCSVVLAVAGIVQYHNETGVGIGGAKIMIELGRDAYGNSIEYRRIKWLGPFNDPNDLGLAFVLAIPFMLHRLAERRYLFSILCFPPVVFALYLTNSRGALLALAVSLIMFFVIRKGKWKGALLALIVIVLIVLFGPSRTGSMSGIDASGRGRLEAWYEGYQILKSNPIFGVGAGGFTNFNDLTAHNSLVLVFAELGLFGAFFFTGLFYFPIVRAIGNLRDIGVGSTVDSSLHKSVNSAMIASLSGVLTSMFFLSRAYVLLPYVVVGMLISFSEILRKSNSTYDKNKSFTSYYHLRNIAVTEVGLIVFIRIMLKTLL